MILRRAQGFTAVELLAVLAIVAILTTVSMPMMSSFIQTSQVRTTALDLVADMQYARSEAIKRNASVMVRPILDGFWAGGWRVYAGTDPATAPILRERMRDVGQIQITTASDSFVYAANGRLDIVGAATTVQLCPLQANNPDGRVVQVQLSGLARAEPTGCAP